MSTCIYNVFVVHVYAPCRSGVVAAIAARRQLGNGTDVAVEIVEPLMHVGGMLAAGMVDDSTKGNTRA